jgi:hypothetical protein
MNGICAVRSRQTVGKWELDEEDIGTVEGGRVAPVVVVVLVFTK